MRNTTKMLLMNNYRKDGKASPREEPESYNGSRRDPPRYPDRMEGRFRDREGRERYDDGRFAPQNRAPMEREVYPESNGPYLPPYYQEASRYPRREEKPRNKIGFSVDGEMERLSQHLGFVYGSVLVDGENTKYIFDVKTGLLSVSVGDIAPGDSRKVSFAAIIKDTAYGETLSNTAILSADNSEDIPVTDTSTKVENGKPGLTAQKSVDKAQAKVGDTLTYTITAKNAEDATVPLENATLSDNLPGFVDFVQGSVMVDGASGHYSFDNGVLTVELGDVEPGSEKTVAFQVTINGTAYNQSSMVGIPNGRNRPSGLGISTRRTGWGWKFCSRWRT